jgi:hypothetical protein
MNRRVYENIVWYGGHFSPPTNSRIRSLIFIGKKVLERTPKNTKSLICIVPNSGLGKGVPSSISQDCISNKDRLAICRAFLIAVTYEAVKEGLDLTRLEYILSEHEITSPTQISIKDSIKAITLATGQARHIYIAKPLDTVLSWFRRESQNSQELISNYSFFIWPQVEGDVINLSDKIKQALHTNNPKKQFYAPITNKTFFKNLIQNRIIIVEPDKLYTKGEPFEVRKLIGLPGPVDGKQLENYMHPIVIDTIRALEIDNPTLYQHPKCKDKR